MEAILRRELKQWQRDFRAKHGRDPTKRDILKSPEIASTYDTWNALTADSAASSSSSRQKTSSSADAVSTGDSSSKAEPSSSPGSSNRTDRRARKDHDHHRRDEAAAPDPKRHRDEGSHATHRQKPPSDVRTPVMPDSAVFKTPTKPRPSSGRGSSSFLTPTHAGSGSSSRLRTPVRTPQSRERGSASRYPPPSPTGSVVDVQMTPTRKATGHLDGAERGDGPYDYAASPSRLRQLVASHSTRSPNGNASKGRAEAAELITYTPRTKARKRLRGEEVPPTPKQQGDGRIAKRGTGATFAAYLAATGSESESGGAKGGGAPINRRRGLASGRASTGGLAAYGFSSLGKPSSAAKHSTVGSGQKSSGLGSVLGVNRSSPLKAGPRLANGVGSTSSRTQPDEEEDDDEDDFENDDHLLGSPSKGARTRSTQLQKGSRTESQGSTGRLSRSASASRSFKPLFASPFGNHAPVKLSSGDMARLTADSGDSASSPASGGGLFAAELAARRTSALTESRLDAGVSSDSEAEDDGAPPSSFDMNGNVIRRASPETGITTPSGGAEAEVPVELTAEERERRQLRQPVWKVSTIVLSDDEDAAVSGTTGQARREAKVITVLPYQRYGSLRNKVASLSRSRSHPAAADAMDLDAASGLAGVEEGNNNTDDDSEGADDDLFGYTLHKDVDVEPLEASGVDEEDAVAIDKSSDSESPSDATQRLLLSALSLSSPRRRQRGAGPDSSTIQHRALLRAQRLNDARHLETLLGAGRDEMEMLRVEDEMADEAASGGAGGSGEGKKAKNWGEAKSRAKPEGAGGKGKGRGRATKAVDPVPAPAAEAAKKTSMAFNRAGRSGLGADENGDADRLADRVLRNHFGGSDDDEDEDDVGEVEGQGRTGAATARARARALLFGDESDEDWASEVDEDDYGLGDGRMDEVDVI